MAASLLTGSPNVNYIGYVEGNDIFHGTADVVVCDGFVGNVALKTSEGLAKVVGQFMREEFSRTWLNRVRAWLAKPVLRSFRRRLDPRRYNGASFAGLQGIVVKSHGNADAVAFGRAIDEAVLEIEKNVPERISHELGFLLNQRQAV
jgi:glycerol-3-phosphate acyltransferase PlsX